MTELYPNFKDYEVGVFDTLTENYVKKFQRDNDLVETGICDNYTWNILFDATEDRYQPYIANHSVMDTTKEPGIYNIQNLDFLNQFQITIDNNNPQQVKYSAIAVYKNGETKTDSKVLTFEGSQTHSIAEFQNMFKDDPKYLTPTDVYYVVYPYGGTPYKWHFVVKV